MPSRPAVLVPPQPLPSASSREWAIYWAARDAADDRADEFAADRDFDGMDDIRQDYM